MGNSIATRRGGPRCARAVSGHVAAAPPSSAMNCRRLMCSPQADARTLPHRQCGCASQQIQVADVRFGSKADISECLDDVRFTPKSGHWNSLVECLLCAKSRHSALPEERRYSITSSARESSDGGTVRPSALAVLRLITVSYLVGACTGRSAGFSPLRMRSTYPAAFRYRALKSGP